jgi:nucleoside 2-deoxyribosyltransferase
VGTCFVMQPFDGGTFDKRYDDVFAPAIHDAGLDPYRVDQDPKVSIPIQDIESGIRESQICLAEITQDNPNVWFELGYAIACEKEVVLVCSDERTTKFPFDVQHRTIIKYTTKSTSDFEKLKSQITARLKACLEKAEKLTTVSEISKLTKFEGLDQHEVVALAALAENLDHPSDNASTFQIKRDMEASGFTRVATTLALKSLLRKGFLENRSYQEEDGDYYTGYNLTDQGWTWILENKDKFILQRPPKEPRF